MKSTTPACADLLNSSRQVFMVELLTLTLIDQSVIRWASSDVAISYGGATWVPGPIIERDAVSLSRGIEVTSCSITFHADDSVTVAGVPLLQAARRGLLGGAQIKIEKGFTDDPANPLLGTVHLFEGRVGDLEINSTTLTAEVKSFTEALDTMVPRNVYQPSCIHTLYRPDSPGRPGCGVTKAAHALNVTAQSGTTATLLKCAVTGSGTYDLGELIGLSGANAGVRRAVKQHTAGQLLVSFPFPDVPAPGDSFTVYKGCDKTMGTCTGRFANLARFKGFPFVPEPETAV